MPARPPHVTRCGDLETSCTEMLLYLPLDVLKSRIRICS
jgi:hypothetical protein